MEKYPKWVLLRLFIATVGIITIYLLTPNNVNAEYYECGTAQCPLSGSQYCCQNDTMRCTGLGCPSYACYTNPGNFNEPAVCSGSWTCCVDSSCAQCRSQYLYLKSGTCEYCPTKPENNPVPTPAPNVPPTAYYSGVGTYTGWNLLYEVGRPYYMRVQARDSNNNLNLMVAHRSPYSSGQTWTEMGRRTPGQSGCTGSACTLDLSWTPTATQTGNWHLSIDAFDTGNLRCTGNFISQSNWYDCDSTPAQYSDDGPSVCVFRCPKSNTATVERVLELGAVTVTPTSASLSFPSVDFGYRCSAALERNFGLYWKIGGPSANLADYTRVNNLTGTEGSVVIGGLSPNTTYNWFIAAANGQTNCRVESIKGSFTTSCPISCPNPITLNQPPDNNTGTVRVSTTPTLSWTGLTAAGYGQASCTTGNVNSLTLYYQNVTNGTSGSVDLSITDSYYTFPASDPLDFNSHYTWYVQARNGNPSCITNSPTWDFWTNYEQASSGWFTALGGNVYSKGMQLYGPAYLNAPSPFITSGLGTVADHPSGATTGGSVFVSGNPITYAPSSPTTLRTKIASSSVIANTNTLNWDVLDRINFSAPSHNPPLVTHLNTSNDSMNAANNMRAGNIYVITSTAALDAMLNCTTSPCRYNMVAGNDGIAIVFYLPSSPTTVNITKQIHLQNENSNRRVLFITNSPVVISRNIPIGSNPTKTSRADLEMGIISTDSITFEGNTANPGTDAPIVIDGPIISENIVFERVTSLNEYPAEIIRFNPVYLTGMRSFAASTDVLTGVFSSEIYWEETSR